MSDHIAHIAICDDTFRLAALHPDIHDTFKTLFTEQREAAHMGSVTRYADKWSADVIAWAADEFAKSDDARDRFAAQKLAFVLGSLTHRAADRLTKPITRCFKGPKNPDGDPRGDSNTSKIMQDLFVWREVYGSGHSPLAAPFTPEALANAATSAEQASEDFFRLMLRRALIAMHTIKPDPDHIQPWFDAFFDGLQTFPKSLRYYAELAAEWDPEKVRIYLTEKNFYNIDDPLILLARRLQAGSTVTADEVVATAADSHAAPTSRYARALAKALDYLIAASELFDRKIDVDAAKTRFDVGVPELSIQE